VVDMEGETKACWDHDDTCGWGSEDAEAGTSGAGREDGVCCGG
jgi:hypothetical protein